MRANDFRPRNNGGLGPLVQSPDCPELWIPENFRCIRLSRSREASQANPALTVPNAMDGMASFALPNGDIRLIRNHEMANSPGRVALLGGDSASAYDPLASGGTMSLTVRSTGSGAARQLRVVEEYVSLRGTHINCAGGRTPWGSWLSCEETTAGVPQRFQQEHGYIFEVPVSAGGPVAPVPLKAMGRMVHEAICVDPRSGVVYETEDIRFNASNPAMPGAGFYRFTPRTPQRLIDGGVLQMLAVRNQPGYNTTRDQRVGQRFSTYWVDIPDPDPANAAADPSALFRQGLANGGALFHRLEGCFWADDSAYFVSTEGGNAGSGQVWRYQPESDATGTLTMIFESPSRAVLDSPDNICVSSRGAVVICEDGVSEQFVRALNRAGQMLDIVKQPVIDGEPDPREFAGCCFSPDGEVLFFNIQGSTTSYGTRQGGTYALWGPWEQAEGI